MNEYENKRKWKIKIEIMSIRTKTGADEGSKIDDLFPNQIGRKIHLKLNKVTESNKLDRC